MYHINENVAPWMCVCIVCVSILFAVAVAVGTVEHDVRLKCKKRWLISNCLQDTL